MISLLISFLHEIPFRHKRFGISLQIKSWSQFCVVTACIHGELPLVVHPKLIYEYQDVLCRPESLAASGVTVQEVEVVLAQLVPKASEIDVRYLWRPNLRDEGDNFVIEIAVAAWPCTIVTHNITDFQRAELRFPHIVLITPGQLMKSWQSKAH